MIDCRASELFAAGHLPGAVHLDLWGVSLIDTTDAPLRAFLQVEGSTDPCNLGRPLTAGLSKFSVTHGLMGDFVIRGYENFTSEDLITPVFSGGGGSGSGGGGPSAF